MQSTGNRDVCFYNDRCYIPSSILGDFPFNLLSSNIPYVLHGIIISVSYLLKERYCFVQGHQGCYDYSLAYAMSWAFIFEGVFSTIYHVCPTRMIFQFDTAFMFVISAIIFLCLLNHSAVSDQDIFCHHHLQHPLPPRPFKSFRPVKVFAFFLAPILVFNYLGSVRDVGEMRFDHEIVFYVFLFLWYLAIVGWGLSKLAVIPSRMKLFAIEPKFSSPFDRALVRREGIEMVEINRNQIKPGEEKEGTQREKEEGGPSYAQLATFHVFSLLLFVWLVYTVVARKDMSQYFLGSCVLSVFVALLSYEVLILHRQQPEGRTPRKFLAVFYLFVFALWGAAGYFFVVMETTNKSTTPAANRHLNKDCILADFYDSHCVWHFLSSNALLLCALRAIYLSQPCRRCQREEEESRLVKSELAHNGTKPGQFETSKIHFPTSKGVSEVSERCERTSERTSEWPCSYVSVLVCSRPQWRGRTRDDADGSYPRWRPIVQSSTRH